MYWIPAMMSAVEKLKSPPFTAIMSASGATPAYWNALPAEPSPAAIPATCEPCPVTSCSLQLLALITAALHSLPPVKSTPPMVPGAVPVVVRSQM